MEKPDRPEIRALRDAILRPSAAAREAFARECLILVRAYLMGNWPRWSLWFNGDLSDAVESAASQVVASLFREEPEGSGRLPVFQKRLLETLHACSCRGMPVGPVLDGDLEEAVRTLDDGTLGMALRRLLRLQGEQGMNEEWGIRHPEKARLRRRVRDWAVARGMLYRNGDGRGTLLAGRDCDLRLRPLSLDELFEFLGAGWADEGEALGRLADHLSPGGAQGGYCFLNDVVRVLFEVMTGRITSEGLAGAIPGALGVRLTQGGLPESIFIERVRERMRFLARGYLEQDAVKGKFTDSPPLAALTEIVTEMVCRDWGMGRPAWDQRSQEEMAMILLPGLTPEEYAREYRSRLDYVIRRVRARVGRGDGISLLDMHDVVA
jgi:hypothetical protein